MSEMECLGSPLKFELHPTHGTHISIRGFQVRQKWLPQSCCCSVGATQLGATWKLEHFIYTLEIMDIQNDGLEMVTPFILSFFAYMLNFWGVRLTAYKMGPYFQYNWSYFTPINANKWYLD